MLAPRSQGIIELDNRWLLGWVVALALAVTVTIAVFPRAFPMAPGTQWDVDRDAAIAVAIEYVSDLGKMPNSPYFVAVLDSSSDLELHLLADQTARAATGISIQSDHALELSARINTWLVTIYPDEAAVGDWTYRVEMTLDGTLLALSKGVKRDFTSPIQLTIEDATARADEFLERMGLALADYYDPVERRVENAAFSYQQLRYQRREAETPLVRLVDHSAVTADDLLHGVEVKFAGGELLGFSAWQEHKPGADILRKLQRPGQVQLLQFLAVFALLPLIGTVFVRRYHLGLVGARRGTRVFAIIFSTAAVALMLSSRAASEGIEFGSLTRANLTLGWAGAFLLIYFPALALVGGLSCAVGESMAEGTWRSRLASLDALLNGHWSNATVAASSLRGVAAGMSLLALLLVTIEACGGRGLAVPLSLQLGPWWQSALLPGISLFLLQLAFSTAAVMVALLFLMPLLAQRFGVVAAGVVSAVALAVLFFSPVVTVPTGSGSLLAGALSLATVALFVRYDFVVAWLAHLILSVGIGALMLMASGDPVLRLQGAGVFLLAAAPLVPSLRWVATRTGYHYRYDDVPPHVRMIADRERQRVELETAKGIQTSILPDLPVSLVGVEVAYSYRPANEIGGDFYDAIALQDGRLAVAIGDVAGHGVSSGLIMSMTRAALSVQVHFAPEVEDVMRALNSVVYGSARQRLLTTLCYALLDPNSRRMSYASAGHLYPYRLSSSGNVSTLASTAYPLGVREQLRVECCDVNLEAGDAVFFATDGLVEAKRLGGEELFGFERLEASLRRLTGLDASRVRDGVLEDWTQFVASGQMLTPEQAAQDDDLTLLVLRLPEDP